MLTYPTSYIQELVSSLHSLIQMYEKGFQVAALRSGEGDRVTTSVTPTGWIHVTLDPPEVETSFETEQPHTVGGTKAASSLTNGSLVVESPPQSLLNGEEGSVPRKVFGSPRTTAMSGKMVHNQIWKGLVLLASDPCPVVSEHAQYIVHSVHDKVRVESNPNTHGNYVTMLTGNLPKKRG